MKFGKLENINKVNWKLPPDHPGNQILFGKLGGKAEKPDIFIGCTGWSVKEWVGKVYPVGTKTADYLYYYSRQFNTIELNTTHYRIPKAETIRKWADESSPEFRFCPKVLQRISHSRDLGISGGLIRSFCEAMEELGDKLGTCFMQLPPYFGVSSFPVLEKFLNAWPKSIPLALEFRHESWFSQLAEAERFFNLLENRGMSMVITDVAGRRDVLHQRLTTDVSVIRFVGNNLDTTDYSRITDWVERLANWFEKGLKQVYFFAHEPDNLLAPDLAAYFVAEINKKVGTTVANPTLDGSGPFETKGGSQISLF